MHDQTAMAAPLSSAIPAMPITATIQTTGKNTQHIRCILFDVGDTLWELSPEGEAALLPAINARVVAILEQHIPHQRWEGIERASVAQQFRHAVFTRAYQNLSADVEHEPDTGRLINQTLQAFRLPPLPITLSREIFEQLRVPLTAARQLFPHAIATLRTLKERGYQLGLVTNRFHGGETFLAELQAFNLLEFFPREAIATSADLGIRKPHPEIFRYALDRLHVSTEETAMVGDNIIADVTAAAQLHMHTVWFPAPWLRTSFYESQDTARNGITTLYDFARIQHDREHPHSRYIPIPPDHTITQLSDLLTIFQEVNKE